MTVFELVQKLDLKILSGGDALDKPVSWGYVSDLLSDVMGCSQEGQVWVTLQTHKNVIAVASLKELSAVIIVKGLEPAKDMIEQSKIENIPVLSTDLESFEIAGKMYEIMKANESLQS